MQDITFKDHDTFRSRNCRQTVSHKKASRLSGSQYLINSVIDLFDTRLRMYEDTGSRNDALYVQKSHPKN